MDEKRQIKAKAYLLIPNNGKVLVHRVLSDDREKDVVRPPGGHIEYGEYSKETAKREVKEELGVGTNGLRLLGPFENIFKDPDGNVYHEIIFVYQAGLEDKAMYEESTVAGTEIDGRKFEMFWVSIQDIQSGKIKFVPNGMDVFLNKLEY